MKPMRENVFASALASRGDGLFTDGGGSFAFFAASTRRLFLIARTLGRAAAIASLTLPLASATHAADESRPPASDESIEFFEKKIRPLLVKHCYECHSDASQEAGLRLDTWQGMATGGDSGPALQPGQPSTSLLLVAVRQDDPTLQMPPDGKLSDAEVADLTRWIDNGAPHPDANGPLSDELSDDAREDEDLWSLQPMVRPQPPAVTGAEWLSNPIDAFVLARLEAAGLAPNPPAERRTLIRRATFDLTGLPPTRSEIEAFVADRDPHAYANLIDRLLASPAYGERWGRHWLDVARYADSNGLDENVAHGNAWRYRDWVVASWNQDLPYADFVEQQIAGDLLPSPDQATRHSQLVATGFLSLGPKVLAEADKVKMEMDIIDEQLDTVGRSFLGLTFGCARCHDHKFDPILTADYYALAGIFKSTLTMDSFATIARWHEHEIGTAEQLAARDRHAQQLAAKKKEVEALIATANVALRNQLGEAAAFPDPADAHYPEGTQQALKELRQAVTDMEKAVPEVDAAMGVSEGKPTDLAIHFRGSHLSLGEVVPRQFPDWLKTSQELSIPTDQSGRLELARWITDRANPLTWRVIVNRVWRWHFGRGLVDSPDNFGRLGDHPTHPQLLDWLASDFADHGGSIKRLHRLIMLSSTYQTRSDDDPAAREIDPANRLLWRSPLRRLEAEALRDSLLMAGGLLDRRMGGSRLHVANRAFLFDHTSKDTTTYDHPVRSLYLPVIRNHLYDGFHLFDFSDASVVHGSRSATTVPTQALFLMNSPLLQQASEALARRILANDAASSDPVQLLYQLAVGRDPSSAERSDVEQTLAGLTEAFAAARPQEPESASEAADAAETTPDSAKESTPTETTTAPVAASGLTPPGLEGIAGDLPSAELQAWSAVCHALLASNEFLYLR